MPSVPKWSLKIAEDKVYLFVNGARHSKDGQNYLEVVRAELGEFKNRVAIKVGMNFF